MIIKHVCGHEANFDFKPEEVDFIEFVQKSKCWNCSPKDPNNGNVLDLIQDQIVKLTVKRRETEEQRAYLAKRTAFAIEIGCSLASTVGYDEQKWAEKSVRMADFLLQELDKTP